MPVKSATIPVAVLETFLDRIAALGLRPSERSGLSWKLGRREKDRTEWQPLKVRWEDWSEGLFGHQDEILAWPESAHLVDSIHESTQADPRFIRGVITKLAEAYLQNMNSRGRQDLIETLGQELRELFTLGLPAVFKSFLSGIKLEGEITAASDVLLRPFAPEDWPGQLDPGGNLVRIRLEECIVMEVVGRISALGQPFDPFDENSYHWQKREEQILRILRLYRVGGVYSQRTETKQITLLRIPLHGQMGGSPGYVSPFSYSLTTQDKASLEAHFEFLKDLPPWKHERRSPQDIALERYESAISSGKYSEEILLYGILGLEALYRNREGPQVLGTRIALLIDLLDRGNPREVRERVRKAYRFRNTFVHGEAIEGAKTTELQNLLMPLLEYLRVSILLLRAWGQTKPTFLRALDNALLVPRDRAKLKREFTELSKRIRLGESKTPK